MAAVGARSYVYFVRAQTGDGPVKIGCSILPEKRLQELMTWSPFPLAVAAKIPGDFRLEWRFHRAFLAQRSHREWFHPCEAIDETIRAIADGRFDVDTLPASKRLPNESGWSPPKWTEGRKLHARLTRVFRTTGIEAPDDVKAAAQRVYRSADDIDDADRSLILAHIEAPWERGSVQPWPWAQATFAKYAAKTGLQMVVRKAA